MKLIVLCGPENSGKTITLKMVYQQLKKFNLLDTHWFKYYDSDGTHRDFRDVLVLNTSRAIASIVSTSKASVRQFDVSNSDDIEKIFPKEEFNLLKKYDAICAEEDIQEIAYDKDYDETEKLDKTYDDEMNGNCDNVITESQCEKDLDNIINEISTIQPRDISTIGLVLEGDYGFTHRKTRSTTTHHSRSLYDHLRELEFCNTLICACSEPKGSSSPIMRPIYCVIKFIIDYVSKYGTITVCKLDSHISTGTSWSTKISFDKTIANTIVSLI